MTLQAHDERSLIGGRCSSLVGCWGSVLAAGGGVGEFGGGGAFGGCCWLLSLAVGRIGNSILKSGKLMCVVANIEFGFLVVVVGREVESRLANL